jgi:hypothetical protein
VLLGGCIELGQDEDSTSAGSWGQAWLFEAFLALLERLAGRSPTVLVVEDLHWADRSTLDLLAFLVRNLQAGLLLVLTYRSDELHRRHPLRPFLAELDRSGRAERLEVGRFGRVDVAHRGRGRIPPPGLVRLGSGQTRPGGCHGAGARPPRAGWRLAVGLLGEPGR